MLRALPRLRVRLQAVAELAQKRRHRTSRDLVALDAQFARERTQTLRRPAQRLLRIATRLAVQQSLEIRQQRRILLAQPLPAGARAAHTARPRRLPRRKLAAAATDRRGRDPRRPRHRGRAAAAERDRLRCRPQPQRPLVKLARQQPKPIPDHRLIRHTNIFAAPAEDPSPHGALIYAQSLTGRAQRLLSRGGRSQNTDAASTSAQPPKQRRAWVETPCAQETSTRRRNESSLDLDARRN